MNYKKFKFNSSYYLREFSNSINYFFTKKHTKYPSREIPKNHVALSSKNKTDTHGNSRPQSGENLTGEI